MKCNKLAEKSNKLFNIEMTGDKLWCSTCEKLNAHSMQCKLWSTLHYVTIMMTCWQKCQRRQQKSFNALIKLKIKSAKNTIKIDNYKDKGLNTSIVMKIWKHCTLY